MSHWLCVLYPFGSMGALYIELSSCFFNKSKLYTRISGTCAEELKRKKKHIRTVKRQLAVGILRGKRLGRLF